MGADAGRPKTAPDEVWDQVREAYLSGVPAAECCRRFGVGRTALRDRAARDSWRRRDQVWHPPQSLEPWDEGRDLEQSVGGDLDQLDFSELAYVAIRRMMRAVLRGDAAGVMRWRRVRLIMDAEQAEVDAAVEADEASVWSLAMQREKHDLTRRAAAKAAAAAPHYPRAADHPDHPDHPDTVFESGRAPPAPL